jgi:hypothetical protein
MGPDYDHPLSLAYHVVLVLVGSITGVGFTAWCRSKMFSEANKYTRHWSGFVWTFGLIGLGLVLWALW